MSCHALRNSASCSSLLAWASQAAALPACTPAHRASKPMPPRLGGSDRAAAPAQAAGHAHRPRLLPGAGPLGWPLFGDACLDLTLEEAWHPGCLGASHEPRELQVRTARPGLRPQLLYLQCWPLVLAISPAALEAGNLHEGLYSLHPLRDVSHTCLIWCCSAGTPKPGAQGQQAAHVSGPDAARLCTQHLPGQHTHGQRAGARLQRHARGPLVVQADQNPRQPGTPGEDDEDGWASGVEAPSTCTGQR